ncbi:MAG: hypothetical protein K6E94_01570, partial [Elusimicrobiaceae bacterium]|nr:hypothetical protein [Elusimicrobiaceae bacterium]
MVGSLVLSFFTSGVFLANFNFSFPRVPRVASLPFFLVHVVKEKLKLSQKYLLGLRARGVALFLCVKEKIKISGLMVKKYTWVNYF